MGDRDLGTDRREDTLEAIFTRSVTINSKEWLATAQPFAKMKGLKISQPQSVARIDHTSFLCERSLLPLSLSLSLCLSLGSRASLLLPTPSIYPFEHPSLTDTAVTRHSSTYPTSVSDVRAFSSLPRLAWKPTVYEILAKTLLRSLLPARPRRRDRTDLDKERERERERRDSARRRKRRKSRM